MDKFHELERNIGLFASLADGEFWWDTVRFEVCYYLFDCLSGLAYSTAHRPRPRKRRLGILRRAVQRQALLVRALVARKELMVVRAPRAIVAGRRHDVVLDPIAELFSGRTLTIDTLPRCYHLPDFEPSRWRGTVPEELPGIIQTLLCEFGIGEERGTALDTLIRHRRGEHACQVSGYRRLFVAAKPKAILLVQNGIEKALFQVAREFGIPTIEAQHGLIGHGHPAYSYPQSLDYRHRATLPDLFLTFSTFWQQSGYYPATQKAVTGTDHFAADLGPMHGPREAIMVITADIYHQELLDLTRRVAVLLPHRRFIYKLHPNQSDAISAIEVALADLPNVTVGDPLVPAGRMMEGVSHLVAIQSTVVYEALQHGRRVCLLPRHDYHLHEDIFDLPEVSVPGTAADLAAALEKPSTGATSPTFFEPFDPQRVAALITPLINGNGRT